MQTRESGINDHIPLCKEFLEKLGQVAANNQKLPEVDPLSNHNLEIIKSKIQFLINIDDHMSQNDRAVIAKAIEMRKKLDAQDTSRNFKAYEDIRIETARTITDAVKIREYRARYKKAIRELHALAKKHPETPAAKNWVSIYQHFAMQPATTLLLIMTILKECREYKEMLNNSTNKELKELLEKVIDAINLKLCTAILAKLIPMRPTDDTQAFEHEDVVYQSMKEFKVKKDYIKDFQKICPVRNSLCEPGIAKYFNEYISRFGSDNHKKFMSSYYMGHTPLTRGHERVIADDVIPFHQINMGEIDFIAAPNENNPSLFGSFISLSSQTLHELPAYGTQDFILLNIKERNEFNQLAELPNDENMQIVVSKNRHLLNGLMGLFVPVISIVSKIIPYGKLLSLFVPMREDIDKKKLAIQEPTCNEQATSFIPSPSIIGRSTTTITVPTTSPSTETETSSPASSHSKKNICFDAFQQFNTFITPYFERPSVGFFHHHGIAGKKNANACLSKFAIYLEKNNPQGALKKIMLENKKGNYYPHSFRTYLLAYYQFLSKEKTDTNNAQDFLAELQKKSPHQIQALYEEIAPPLKMTSEVYLAMKM